MSLNSVSCFWTNITIYVALGGHKMGLWRSSYDVTITCHVNKSPEWWVKALYVVIMYIMEKNATINLDF